jgi:hypothetical protein
MQERMEGLNSTSRLLPGEQDDVRSSYLEDAARWRRVYEELLTAKIRMITELVESIAVLESSAARRELEATDLRLLEAQAERYERRLSFWRQREWDLQRAAMVDANPSKIAGRGARSRSVASREGSYGSRETVMALIPGFLEGEDPESTDLVDAKRWLSVYQCLLGLEREVLDRVLELASRLDDTARRAVELSNIAPMKELIELLEERAAHWQNRLDQAGAG